MELETAIIVVLATIIGAVMADSRFDWVSAVGWTILTINSGIGAYCFYLIIQNFKGIPA